MYSNPVGKQVKPGTRILVLFADLANQGLIISTTRLKQWTVDDNKVILVLLLLSLPLKK